MGRLNDLALGKVEAPKLDPRIIIVRHGYNYRDVTTPEAKRHIAWLKESIREHGVQKPIGVEYIDGKVYLVDGECRLSACVGLWQDGVEVLIPAIVVKGDEAEVRAKSIIANGALPPTILEFGKAAAQLRAYGWSDEKISQYTPPHIASSPKRAKKYVQDAVELHEAPLEVKKAVMEGVDGVKVSPALAVSAVRKGRLMAGQVIKQEVDKAKSAGKTEVHRPKGEGKATKAKKEKEKAIYSIMDVGDTLALLVLADHPDWDQMTRVARIWQSMRKDSVAS
jgi:ParB-like chromosome segregation protein Spo0J